MAQTTAIAMYKNSKACCRRPSSGCQWPVSHPLEANGAKNAVVCHDTNVQRQAARHVLRSQKMTKGEAGIVSIAI